MYDTTADVSLADKVHLLLALELHHRQVFGLVRQYQLAARADSGLVVLPALLSDSIAQLSRCFCREETLLRSLLPSDELVAHCREHAAILDQLEELQGKAKAGEVLPRQIAHAMDTLIIHHVMETDPMRRSQGYIAPVRTPAPFGFASAH